MNHSANLRTRGNTQGSRASIRHLTNSVIMDAAYLRDFFGRIPRLVGIYTVLHLKLLKEFTEGLMTLPICVIILLVERVVPLVREGKGNFVTA